MTINPSLVVVSGVLWILLAGVGAVATQTHALRRRLPGAVDLSALAPRWIPARLLHLIERMALPVSPIRALTLWFSAVLLVLILAVLRGLSGTVIVLVGLVIFVPAALLLRWRGRRDRLIQAALPAALEIIGRAVRSGASFGEAVGETADSITGPLAHDLRELHRRVGLGVGFAAAVAEWSGRRSLPAVRLAVAALTFSHEAGGARSRALDGLADSLRDQLAVEAEIVALASQARMSAMVVAVLPVGFVALSTSVDDAVAAFLFREPLGVACLLGGVLLDVVGFVWMRRMTAAIQ